MNLEVPSILHLNNLPMRCALISMYTKVRLGIGVVMRKPVANLEHVLATTWVTV